MRQRFARFSSYWLGITGTAVLIECLQQRADGSKLRLIALFEL